jgi:hypothetical protein
MTGRFDRRAVDARKVADCLPESGKSVPPIWCEKLCNAKLSKNRRITPRNIVGGMVAAQFAEKSCCRFDNDRIRIRAEVTFALADFANQPELRETSFDAKGVRLESGIERRLLASTIHEKGQTFRRVFDARQSGDQLTLFFSELHRYEMLGIDNPAAAALPGGIPVFGAYPLPRANCCGCLWHAVLVSGSVTAENCLLEKKCNRR